MNNLPLAEEMGDAELHETLIRILNDMQSNNIEGVLDASQFIGSDASISVEQVALSLSFKAGFDKACSLMRDFLENR